MKRIISFFAAAVLLTGLFSCSEDKNNIIPENTVTENVTENTSEISSVSENVSESRKEYYSDNFRDITVRTIMSYDEPPCSIESYDLKNLDFGERIPICNRAEYADFFFRNQEHLRFENGIYTQVQRTDLVTDQPEEGRIIEFSVIDGKVYFIVEYGSSPRIRSFFEWSFFRYDLNSSNLEELYSWSSDDINKVTCSFALRDNELFYCEINGEDLSVNIVDLSTMKERTVFEKGIGNAEAFLQSINSVYANIFGSDLKDEVLLEIIEYTSGEVAIDIYAYDGQSDSFKGTDGSIASYELNGEYYKLHMEGYDFNIKEDCEIGSPIYGDDRYLICYRGYGIDTFDLEKKMHYTSSLDDYNIREIPVVVDGKIIMNCNSVKLLLPDYGIVYTVLEKGEYRQTVIPDGGVAVFETTKGKEKLYIIK